MIFSLLERKPRGMWSTSGTRGRVRSEKPRRCRSVTAKLLLHACWQVCWQKASALTGFAGEQRASASPAATDRPLPIDALLHYHSPDARAVSWLLPLPQKSPVLPLSLARSLRWGFRSVLISINGFSEGSSIICRRRINSRVREILPFSSLRCLVSKDNVVTQFNPQQTKGFIKNLITSYLNRYSCTG